jgi:hypothetical protein
MHALVEQTEPQFCRIRYAVKSDVHMAKIIAARDNKDTTLKHVSPRDCLPSWRR